MLTDNEVCLLEQWKGLTVTCLSDEDDVNEELLIWRDRASVLIGWLLKERVNTPTHPS